MGAERRERDSGGGGGQADTEQVGAVPASVLCSDQVTQKPQRDGQTARGGEETARLDPGLLFYPFVFFWVFKCIFVEFIFS